MDLEPIGLVTERKPVLPQMHEYLYKTKKTYLFVYLWHIVTFRT